MSSDAKTVYLAMTVTPNAGKAFTQGGTPNPSRFSNAIKYVININSRAAGSAGVVAGAAGEVGRYRFIATFDGGNPQKISLWLVDVTANQTLEYITGDPSSTNGITSSDKKVRVFAGLRDDPFFFNLQGLLDVETFVNQNASSLPQPDAAGCYALDANTQAAAAQTLRTGGDFFANFNTLAIVLAVDKTLLTSKGSLLGVWGSTHR
jgi:hypothetical protein